MVAKRLAWSDMMAGGGCFLRCCACECSSLWLQPSFCVDFGERGRAVGVQLWGFGESSGAAWPGLPPAYSSKRGLRKTRLLGRLQVAVVLSDGQYSHRNQLLLTHGC